MEPYLTSIFNLEMLYMYRSPALKCLQEAVKIQFLQVAFGLEEWIREEACIQLVKPTNKLGTILLQDQR